MFANYLNKSKMRKFLFLFIALFSLAGNNLTAQDFAHELGAMVGPTNFRSDFGERGNSKTNFKNTGFGVGILHYFNFAYKASCSCFNELTYFNDHFKLRSELSYYFGKLSHEGQWAAQSQELRDMDGKFTVTNIGTQLEYYPMSIREFGARGYSFAPYFALGLNYALYSPEVEPTPKFYKYNYSSRNVSSEGGSTFSIMSSIGTRYKVGRLSDIFVEAQWMYYFDDWVDGLNPNPDIYSENIANDWIFWLNVGYIYTFL